ncbi:MAG TPA: hypothetical protein GXZ82_04410 [Firmicutes bacterium]|jgi:hypothetical protein|nr:hypothetical protein [Bacillota bacterium]
MIKTHSIRCTLRRRLALAGMILSLVIVLGPAAAAAPATPPRKPFYLQATVGSDYRLEHPTAKWRHLDNAELSIGHRFGNWFETQVTGAIRTDAAVGLRLGSRLRLLRLGPLSLGFRAHGNLGTTLHDFSRKRLTLTAGPDGRLQLGTRHVSLWALAGFQTELHKRIDETAEPIAELGAAIQPNGGLSGVVANVTYTITENPMAPDQLEGAWAGQVGYRKAF